MGNVQASRARLTGVGLMRGERDLGGLTQICFKWSEIRLAAGRKADVVTRSPKL
jgi:hypothetical protein